MARPLYTFNALIVACGRVCSKLCHSILVSMLSMFISLQLPRFRFRVVSMPSTFITTPQTALCNGFFCVLGIDVNCFAFVTSCKFNGCDGVFFLQSGASNDAIELFEEMQKLGVRPDRITYVGVISATTASGQWDLAQSFIRKMQVCTLVCFS